MHGKSSVILGHAAMLFAAMVVLASCGADKSRIIPRSTMVDIYADLFLSDQWLVDHGRSQSAADSTLFYEPVFNKYGYDTDDFMASVDYYLRDPIRFSRMLKKSYALLNDAADAMEASLERISSFDEEASRLASYAVPYACDTLIGPVLAMYQRSFCRIVPGNGTPSVQNKFSIKKLDIQ